VTAGRRRRLLTAAWRGSALTATFALIGLLVISGMPGNARLALRADAYNQLTGIGSTASAITVPWTAGLLNAQNQPVTSDTTDLSPNADRQAYAANPASATSPLSFMYSDFENLQVTVSQTEDITHQGITVSWSGAKPSSGGAPLFDFMQMMECYGDTANGPSPEDCEYGSQFMLGTVPGPWITNRIGYICSAGQTPSAQKPATGVDGVPAEGCDANEPTSETPAHCDPNATGPATCTGGQFSIPFVPDNDPTGPLYGQTSRTAPDGTTISGLESSFNQFNTNEVQAAYTDQNGNGQQQFETLTRNQAPGLGCGETESNGQTRNCWLVIVPRGHYEPNGFKVSPSVPLNTSPLSAGNWAQRIQVHLGYAPLSKSCPLNVIPDAMDGTELISRAVGSWQAALNQAAQCSKLYTYTATTESSATNALQNAGSSGDGSGAGLAFTTIPIGSEAIVGGGKPPTLPPILYAPVAVTAIDFGFNVNQGASLTTPVKLTPSLVAKALTQVYLSDLPDYDPDFLLPGPTWAQRNPLNITADPAFQALNSEVGVFNSSNPIFPLIIGDHTAEYQRIWQWIQSDAATASWLDGGSDPGNPVAADPAFFPLNLGKAPGADQFDEAYSGALTCSEVSANINNCGGPPDLSNPTSSSCVIRPGDTANPTTKACLPLNSEDMLPVKENFDQAAATVLAASDSGNTRTWDPTAKAADGSSGWFSTVGTELPGQTFMWTVAGMPDLAAYGLISAAVCDPTGATCTQPSTDSVTAALNSATADSAGLLQVNPATVPSGGYPLTDVVYAAVATDQPASALADYASFIAYAAGQGQTTGSAPGNLPPGYLPLPASLQAQAQSVVTQLQTLAGGTASPTASPTTSTTGTPSTTQQQTTGGGTTTTGGGTGGSTTTDGGTTGGTTTSGTTTSGGTTTGGTTTSGGTTTGGTTTGGRTTGNQTPTTRANSTCSPSATEAPTASVSPSSSPSASPSRSAASTAAPTSTACASPGPTVAFDVLPPAAQAAAGTTPLTTVGSIRVVLIIVLIIGAAGAVAGGLLRYGRLPGRGRSRQRTDGP
jgi:hypothetical protein